MLEVKWKGKSGLASNYYAICFNPCYVGSKMEREPTAEGGECVPWFQSLLCWK